VLLARGGARSRRRASAMLEQSSWGSQIGSCADARDAAMSRSGRPARRIGRRVQFPARNLAGVPEGRRPADEEHACLDHRSKSSGACVSALAFTRDWPHYSVSEVAERLLACASGIIERRTHSTTGCPHHMMSVVALSPGKLMLAALIALGCRSGWREIHSEGQHTVSWRGIPIPPLVSVAWTASTDAWPADGW